MTPELVAILTLTSYLLIALIVITVQSLRCEHGVVLWWIFVLERILCPFLWGVKTNRRCPFPDDGAAIIIANHRGPADPALVWSNLHLKSNKRRIRAINFLMAKEIYEVKAMNWMYRALQSVPVDRNGQDMVAVREALKRLKQGELVGIFPEGGINEGEGLMHANSGVAWIALKAKVPVYPVFIHGTPIGKTMTSYLFKPASVRLVYGDPIDLSKYFSKKVKQEELQQITNQMMQYLAELGGTFYRDEPDDGDYVD